MRPEDKNVWIVGGGDLAGQFADVGLLDEVIVYIAPVTLGRGQAAPPAHGRAAPRGARSERRLRLRQVLGRVARWRLAPVDGDDLDRLLDVP